MLLTIIRGGLLINKYMPSTIATIKMKTTSTANAAKRDAAVSTWPAPSTRLIKIVMPITLIRIAKTIFVIQSPLCFKAIAPLSGGFESTAQFLQTSAD